MKFKEFWEDLESDKSDTESDECDTTQNSYMKRILGDNNGEIDTHGLEVIPLPLSKDERRTYTLLQDISEFVGSARGKYHNTLGLI
jgi:hypothetical protein